MTRIDAIENLRKVGFINIKTEKPFSEVSHHLALPDNYSLAKGESAVYFLSAQKPKDSSKKIVYLGLDDFGEANSNLDLLWRLRNYFDDFKVNLFAIPDNCLNNSFVEYIQSLGWIKLLVHGYSHTHYENLDEITLNILSQRLDKLYKAPFWELSDEMYQRLQKLEFKIFLQPDDPREGIKYNWDIAKPIPDIKEIHGYGHIYQHDYKSKNGNMGNSLFHYWENIQKLPKNTEFRFY